MDRRAVGGWVVVKGGASWFAVTFLLVGLMFLSTVSNVHAATIIGTDPAVGTKTCSPCGSTLSWTHTVGSNVNRILIVGISANPVSVDVSITTVKFGSNSLTPLTPQSVLDNVAVQQWYLLNPPSGSALVAVSFTSSSAADAVGASASFFNVAGAGASNGATGSSSGASVAVNANSGDLVVDTIATGIGSGASSDASQTQLWNLNVGGVLGAGSDKPASSNVNMQWTFGSVTLSWALVAVDLQPAAIPPIPEYPLGLPLLAIFMIVAYGVIKRRSRRSVLANL
jgi:hypothetical protein